MSDYITVDGQTYDADRIRRLRAKSERLTEAINNAIDTANGRETEWGDRAQMAFEHLHDAIRANEQADAAILREDYDDTEAAQIAVEKARAEAMES